MGDNGAVCAFSRDAGSVPVQTGRPADVDGERKRPDARPGPEGGLGLRHV